MFPFDPKKIFKSLQIIEETLDSKLVKLSELPVSEIYSNYGSIILQHAKSDNNEI